jgi:hypothetical protein
VPRDGVNALLALDDKDAFFGKSREAVLAVERSWLFCSSRLPLAVLALEIRNDDLAVWRVGAGDVTESVCVVERAVLVECYRRAFHVRRDAVRPTGRWLSVVVDGRQTELGAQLVLTAALATAVALEDAFFGVVVARRIRVRMERTHKCDLRTGTLAAALK